MKAAVKNFAQWAKAWCSYTKSRKYSDFFMDRTDQNECQQSR